MTSDLIRRLRPACAGLLASALVATAGAAPAKSPAAHPPASAEPGSGVAIGKAPAWVRQVQPEPMPAGVPAAAVHVLLFDRQTRLPDAGSSAVYDYLHVIRQVNETSGLPTVARIEAEFDPSYQRLQWHTLAVWRQGKRIEKLPAARFQLLHREQQLEQQLLDGRLTATAVLDDLRLGDQVEVAYSIVGGNPVFGGRFVDIEWALGSTGPIADFRYRLLAPAARKLRYQVDPSTVQTVETLLPGAENLRETTFRRRGAPMFRPDPYEPPAESLKEQIQISEFADWGEVARWAEGLFTEASRAGPNIEQAAVPLRKAASDAAGRALGALDLVQRDVRYFGTEIGPYTHQPAAAERVLAQRFGDCKDKVSLLVALLRALDVQATPVLVSARYRQDVTRMLPSPLAFDHAVATVTVDGRKWWLDATRALQTGPLADREALGLGLALPAVSGGALTAAPGSEGQLMAETEDRFVVSDFGAPMRIETQQTLYGELAERVRAARAGLPPAEFQQVMTSEHLRLYGGAVVDGMPDVIEVAHRNAVTVKQRLLMTDAWRFPEERLLTTDFGFATIFSVLRLPDQNARQAARRLAQPGIYRHAIEFRFPDAVFSRPGSSRHEERTRQFALELRQENGLDRQRMEAELRLSADRVEAAEWTTYRDQLARVWPRLGGTLSVSAVRATQWDALRQRLSALDDDLRSGRVKAVTPTQRDARTRVLLLGAQLDSGRLPPKLQAQALVARGQSLDHVGDTARGRMDFERALELDPANADADAALAVNALIRGDDAAAVRNADQAIAKRPSANDSKYIRSYAQYMAGDPAGAREGLKALLEQRGEVERGYAQVWLYLAARAVGANGRAELQAFVPRAAQPPWPYSVVRYFGGELDLASLLREAQRDGQTDPGRLCELYFFAAEKARLDGDVRQARAWYQRSLDTGVVEFLEYGLSARRIAAGANPG